MIRQGGNRPSEETNAPTKNAERDDALKKGRPGLASEHPAVTTEARIFQVDTNFQQMARRPGGISRDRAIEWAETEIADLEANFDEWLNRELTELAIALAAARDHPHDSEPLVALADRCRQLCDVTAVMRFELLSFVAASLCDLLDSINVEAELPVDSIVCHLDSLSLAARPHLRRLRPEQARELTKGLRRLVKHAGG
jgi:hypothetical protein